MTPHALPSLVFEILVSGRTPRSLTLRGTRFIIGRETGDVVLGDPAASAIHAEIECARGCVIIRDLGSRNGTYRDEQRLSQFAITVGQNFSCGGAVLRLIAANGLVGERGAGVASLGATQQIGQPGSPGPSFAPRPQTMRPPQAPAVEASHIRAPAASQTLVAPTLPPGPTPSLAGSGVLTPFHRPVANAVIRADVNRRRPFVRTATSLGPRRWQTLAMWIAATAALATVVSLGVFVGLKWWSGRGLVFVRDVAAGLPHDTVALVALRQPRDAIDLLGAPMPPAVLALVGDQLRVDSFSPDALEPLGIDTDLPAGWALLDAKAPVFAVSVGVRDASTFLGALRDRLPTLAGVPARSIAAPDFDDVAAIHATNPVPLTAWVHDNRGFVVWSPSMEGNAAVEHSVASMLAPADTAKRLSDAAGLTGLASPTGEVLLAAYIDGPALRTHLASGPRLHALALQIALSELDAVAVSLARDGARIRIAGQAVLSEDSRPLEVARGRERTGDAQRFLPAPVLAEADIVVDRLELEAALGLASTVAGGLFSDAQAGFRAQTGIDLRTDIVANLAGDFGAALVALPRARDTADVSAVVWAGVADETRAAQALSTLFAGAERTLGIRASRRGSLEMWELGSAFADPRQRPLPFISAGVAHGYVWFGMGAAQTATILEGSATPYYDDPRHHAIANVRDGGFVGGFADVAMLVEAATPLLPPDARKHRSKLVPVLDLVEALTLQSRVTDHAIIAELLVHTDSEDGLDTLAHAALEAYGPALADALESAQREHRCAQLVAHLQELVGAHAREHPGVHIDGTLLENAARDQCHTGELPEARVQCYVDAERLDELSDCDQSIAASEPQPDREPKVVPYTDDIWEHTLDSARDGTADARVNYAVDLGSDPAIRGRPTALVTIIEFLDFECPYSRAAATTLDEVLARNPEIRLVVRHHPSAGHRHARAAARAAIAAGRQGKFWGMHDRLFERPEQISESHLRTWARDLGLDLVRFERDMADPAIDTQIDADIAAAELFGATTTPFFFVNGRPVAGDRPAAVFEPLVAEERERAERFVERRGDTRAGLYDDMVARFAPRVERKLELTDSGPDSQRYLVPTAGLPHKGSAGLARVAIVECGDFDCPFCDRARTTIDEVLAKYPTAVAIYFAHNPLSFHTGAEPAARAAVAAGQQGQFWPMHDALFDDRTRRSRADLVALAESLGLDTATFEADFDAATTLDTVKKQQRLCTENDATGTPSFFINGKLLTGAQPLSAFAAIIDEELAAGI